MKLYCLPGLGTNHFLFDSFKSFGLNFEVLEHPEPIRGESLRQYAMRIAERIPENIPFALMGVSFGGILAQEIAQLRKPVKLILISTVMEHKEKPVFMRVPAYFALQRLLPAHLYKIAGQPLLWMLGKMNKTEKKIFVAMMYTFSDYYLYWACDRISRWKGAYDFSGIEVIRLHGTKDFIFPFVCLKHKEKIKTIDGGEHIAIVRTPEKVLKLAGLLRPHP